VFKDFDNVRSDVRTLNTPSVLVSGERLLYGLSWTPLSATELDNLNAELRIWSARAKCRHTASAT
jgi:hypothetical protein